MSSESPQSARTPFSQRPRAVTTSVLLAVTGFAVFRSLVTTEVLEVLGLVITGTLSELAFFQLWERNTRN